VHDRDIVSAEKIGVTSRFFSTRITGYFRNEGTARNAGLLLALLAALVFLAIFSPRYVSFANFTVVALQMAHIGIAALGTALLIIGGNIDLSIGSMFGLTAVVSAMLAKVIPPPLALMLGVGLSGLLGLINGALVWRVKISPIIITLGSLTILRGVALLLTGGYGIRGVPKEFGLLGKARPFDIPMPVIALVISAMVVSVILGRTTIGRHIYAIGGNREASEAAGLNVRRLVLGSFTCNGLIVGLSAILAASRLGTAQPTFGVGFELDVITAVILGGVAFTGGEGNIAGVMLAVALLGVINSGLVSLGVNPHYTEIVKGGALVLAVTIDQITHERRERRRTLLAMRERS
jgi:ribose/xylose/arabinose/galactoside ABC-type transport system permease subunit